MNKEDFGKILRNLSPESVVFATDMTGSVLNQSPGGFSQSMQDGLRTALDKGLALLLITGDSFATTKKCFIDVLAYQGKTPYYVMPGSGYSVIEVVGSATRELFTGTRFSKEQQCELLDGLETEIQLCLEQGFSFTAEDRIAYFADNGCRKDIGPRIKDLQSRILVEIIPNKVTVYLPDAHQAEGRGLQLLNAFAANATVKDVVASSGGYAIQGANYVDVITTVKSDGIHAFNSLPESQSIALEGRTWIKAGDSRNDRELFTYPVEISAGLLTAYYGGDDTFVEELRVIPSCGELCYLKNEFTKGGEFVVENMVVT